LSHRDADLVLNDVTAVLEGLITDMLAEKVSVAPLIGIREALRVNDIEARTAPSGIREYVTLPNAA
jgi:hypothetical protein